MSDAELPASVREFVVRHLDSVAELEGLLLARSDRDTRWTAGALAERLYIGEPAAALVLAALSRRGLLSEERDGFLYAPSSAELEQAVEALASAYPRFLIPITLAIHSKPRALRDFAEAFRLREEK
jgi:hypothetical protein